MGVPYRTLLRIEKHFKAEQVARRKAEEAAAAADRQVQAEREVREKLELELKNRSAEGERTAALKAALAAERGALEAERTKVEAQIEEARSDARRSAEALARAEEAIRQEETAGGRAPCASPVPASLSQEQLNWLPPLCTRTLCLSV